MKRLTLVATFAVCALSLAGPGLLSAQPAPPSVIDDPLLSQGALDARIAIMRFDALGMDAEPVARLEALFRHELDRLARHPLPSRRAIESTIRSSRQLRSCSGDNQCLAEIGRALAVDMVVSGNVAALGDSYILDIKVVDSRSGRQIRRISSDPLRGNPDELIEAVRVAAYRLLAPDELVGSLAVLSELVGATVKLDGKAVGKTPLPGPLYKLPLGEHRIDVEAEGYVPYREKVEVRFQKFTRVVVRLAIEDSPQGANLGGPEVVRKRPAARPWYTSTWFYAGACVAAGIVGGYVGYRLGSTTITNCTEDPGACASM